MTALQVGPAKPSRIGFLSRPEMTERAKIDFARLLTQVQQKLDFRLGSVTLEILERCVIYRVNQ
jgi:hypothetical protein